jgi:hypothetical protein
LIILSFNTTTFLLRPPMQPFQTRLCQYNELGISPQSVLNLLVVMAPVFYVLYW